MTSGSRVYIVTGNVLILTTLPETPETRGTLSFSIERTSTDLVLGLGASEAAAALVQRVVARVTAGGGLTR